MSTLHKLHKIALLIPCGYCGAASGVECHTVSGRRAQWPHGTRLQPVWEANSLGYSEGMYDAERWPDSVPGWAKYYRKHYEGQSS